MIFFIEGLSKSGKTFLVDKLCTRNPKYIRFKGSGAVNVGMTEKWHDYNFHMHNIIERLDSINNYKKIILWDRGLTDSVYSENDDYRSEILRVSKSHAKKSLIYINFKDFSEYDENILSTRNSKEGGDAEVHFDKYSKVKESFDTLNLYFDNDAYYISENMISEVEKFIKSKINE